jgi:hypothetical protein
MDPIIHQSRDQSITSVSFYVKPLCTTDNQSLKSQAQAWDIGSLIAVMVRLVT